MCDLGAMKSLLTYGDLWINDSTIYIIVKKV